MRPRVFRLDHVSDLPQFSIANLTQIICSVEYDANIQITDNPKQIYHCDFPDCHRSFVRQDLCARHKERHTARGSQLLRKDNFMHNINPIVTAALQSQTASKMKQPGSNASAGAYQSNGPYHGNQIMQSPSSATGTARSETSTPLDHSVQSPAISQNVTHLGRGRSDDSYRTPESTKSEHPGSIPRSAGFGSGGSYNQGQRPPQAANAQGYNNTNSPYITPAQNFSRPFSQQGHTAQSQQGPNYQGYQANPPLATLPPPGFSTLSHAPTTDGSTQYPPQADSATSGDVRMGATSEAILEGMTPTYAIPMFGGEGYSRSPFAMADDFAAWLFNDSQFGPGASPMYNGPGGMPNPLGNSANFSLQAPYFTHDPMVNGYFSAPIPSQHPMAVNNLIDTNTQQMLISEERRQEILELIEGFNDGSHPPVKKKEEILDGNREDEHHVLSLHMMQTYIGSYWLHFHPQMPILHKPTFEANKCPPLLLIAMLSLGASCLSKSHGFDVTQNCAELANFLVWYLRWELFQSTDARPPAKLWIFQALLLLEIFEKMYSTRPLHERAHIHHATTLTLMRRGSSLIGRSSVDSPPSGTTSSHDGRSKSISGGGGTSSYTYTPDEWWNQWITNEATRRAAFAAFVMDSIHATMFGHSAVMVAHEMRLPLPCDEALWSAASSAEVGRVEQSLMQNGIKPTNFLDGLKKTLNNQPVRTNSFGRTILMAGLLSVSWHMNQRDLQVSSLGVTSALGGRDKWRGSLTRAFDFWKADLDDSLAKAGEQNNPPYYPSSRPDDENIFESRTVLHHLAHMAMHVDIVDCQIFAGASRLLGRSITPQDYNGAQRRMKEGWAPTARARDATFYALRFLSQVLMPHEHGSPNHGPASHNARDLSDLYSARDDVLLNRPWVLYFATLIVWSYGFALDGPIKPMYALTTHDQVIKDMRGYLNRVGGVRAPDDLAHKTNRNACLGLLVLMRDTFLKTRWELLHEASKLLQKCIEMLAGGQPIVLPQPPQG
jgi:hypothetical protein